MQDVLSSAVIFAASLFNPMYANAPEPKDYDVAVHAYLDSYLRDPESARVALVRAPRYARLSTSVFTSVTGWAACYRINAKNGYGGYTGNKLHIFFFEGDKVVDHQADDPKENTYIAQTVRAECALPEAIPLAATVETAASPATDAAP